MPKPTPNHDDALQSAHADVRPLSFIKGHETINALQTLDGKDVPCQWFLMCSNVALTTQHHPILGDVPICQRCKEKYDRMK